MVAEGEVKSVCDSDSDTGESVAQVAQDGVVCSQYLAMVISGFLIRG